MAQRVREGGHAVPPERILARYPRTLENLTQAIRLANVSYLYDGAEVTATGPQLVAVCTPHETTPLVAHLPQWVQQMVGR